MPTSPRPFAGCLPFRCSQFESELTVIAAKAGSGTLGTAVVTAPPDSRPRSTAVQVIYMSLLPETPAVAIDMRPSTAKAGLLAPLGSPDTAEPAEPIVDTPGSTTVKPGIIPRLPGWPTRPESQSSGTSRQLPGTPGTATRPAPNFVGPPKHKPERMPKLGSALR